MIKTIKEFEPSDYLADQQTIQAYLDDTPSTLASEISEDKEGSFGGCKVLSMPFTLAMVAKASAIIAGSPVLAASSR